jgi:acyl dehydratase
MAIDSQAIKELESQVGVEWPPLVYEVEKGMIRRFTQAVGDPNPLWQDEGYAKKTGYGGVIAPPNFILTLGFNQLQQVLALGSLVTVLHGSTELECYQPVRSGDAITVTTRIKNVRERQSKMGRTVFITLDMVYKNQKQEVVAGCRQMAIIY